MYLKNRIEVKHYDCVESTNTLAKQINSSAPTLIVADSQTCGKGRGEKRFFSPDGGVYMSLYLPSGYVRYPSQLTCAVAVAVCRSIAHRTDSIPEIKWVNDIIVDRRKVCGILCEKTENGYVAGIGVNVCAQSFPDDVAQIASYVSLSVSKDRFIAETVDEILSVIALPLHSVMDEYSSRSLMKGKRVRFMRNGKTVTAVAVGISNSGALIIDDGGVQFEITSGDVTVLDIYD